MARAAYFFYSDVKDLCSANNFTFEAEGNTDEGALCASLDFARSRGVYACPAGQQECWTAPGPSERNDEEPWLDPIECGEGDRSWYCNGSWEKCPEDDARTNQCFANTEMLSNPLASVQPSIASQIGQSAIAARVTGVLSQTAVPTALPAAFTTASFSGASSVNVIAASASSVFSSPTRAFSSGTASATSSSNSAGNASDSTESGDAAEASVSPATQAQTSSKPSGLGTGAIAGIAVGAAVAVILFLLIAFILFRRRKQQRRALVAVRDQSLDDDEPEEKKYGGVHHEVHSLHNIPSEPSVRSHSVYSRQQEDVGPPPKSSGGVSIGARSLSAMSAVSALSATTPAMPVAPVSPILSPIDITPSPIETPPSPMVTEVKQGPSHLVAHHVPDRPVSPLLAEEDHHPTEGQSLVPALEPSPLQRLINGQYAPNK